MQRKSIDQPYIVFKSHADEIIRDITIINGQPYYRSTGYNSGMPETWLPFVMLRGTELCKAFRTDPSDSAANWEQIADNFLEKNMPVPRMHLPQKFEVKNIEVLDRIEKRKQALSNKELNNESKRKNINENERSFLKLFSHIPYPYYEMENIYIHHIQASYIIKYNHGIVNHIDTSLDLQKISPILKELSKGKYGNLGRIICKEHLIVSMRLGGGIWLNPDAKALLMNAANITATELTTAPYKNILLNQKPVTESRNPDAINKWLILNGARDIFEIYKCNEATVGFLREIMLSELTFRNTDELKSFTLGKKKRVKKAYETLFKLIDNILAYQLPLMHTGEFLQEIVISCKNLNNIIINMIPAVNQSEWNSLWHKSDRDESAQELKKFINDIELRLQNTSCTPKLPL